MTRRRVAFETLGCKLNQYETDALASGFLSLGWEVAAGGPVDAWVVNTCTVTNNADKKSRHAVEHQLKGTRPPVVVVTGCFAESARESLEGRDGITFVVPNARKNQIPALVDAHVRGEVAAPNLPPADPFGYPVHQKVFHTRASLKIQDGCDNFCSFCIIPSVRGRAVSRPLDEVLAAAQGLLADGRKELVLTGVNMGRWSQGTLKFTDLVAALLALPGDFRLRITSLEPEGLGEAFADLLLHPKMAPHLHLCLQSGSPRMLLDMRREYNLDQYRNLLALLRTRRPDLNVTTDLIVGFPGETEEDFQRSLDEITGADFGFVHVFPYSRRQDTRAERMEGQVPEAVKAGRSRIAQSLVRGRRTAKMESLVGSRRTVLVETGSRGLTEDYYPVRVPPSAPWNSFVEVKLTRVLLENGEPVFEGVLA